ncbi:hypothetical protein [Roseateles sp. LYH14W]|uniref:Peptidase M4 n=1 Tax=Pelomonas parva TaxID=3299032 RepID=A0ABW7EY88_9BURK
MTASRAPAPTPVHAASQPARPTHRLLRGYAFDPSLATRLETALVSEVRYRVPWEALQPGPCGEYVEVIDVDPASGCFYAPVNLDHPHILAQHGLAPSEGNPQFHQQMVYAAAMTTIHHFERALGRKALWAERKPAEGEALDEAQRFVQRLRIYPHALRMANAYYSRHRGALLFGYFPATQDRSSGQFPGGMVFTCLSHDVVAHETAHALLDGFHDEFMEATNPDVLAFHEAFADIVALFRHFTFPEVLRHQIAKTRGDLSEQNLLGQLATQFGQAQGLHGALRDAIGRFSPELRKWVKHDPQPTELDEATEVHARGAILVAAVFDAFLSIYRSRTSDLMRLASEGTGVLRQGELQSDLVDRLAQEAGKAASHVLTMCIRALDYCPPVDLTFGEFLRALITADIDLMPEDRHGYRIAFIEAFRRRGIYPHDIRTLSQDSLRWAAPNENPTGDGKEATMAFADFMQGIDLLGVVDRLRRCRTRFDLWQKSRCACRDLHDIIRDYMAKARLLEVLTGLALSPGSTPSSVRKNRKEAPKFYVHSLREARRQTEDGQVLNQVFLTILQTELADGEDGRQHAIHCGSTLVIDLDGAVVRYAIRKGLGDEQRIARIVAFREAQLRGQSLAATYFGAADEPFAALHRCGA